MSDLKRSAKNNAYVGRERKTSKYTISAGDVYCRNRNNFALRDMRLHRRFRADERLGIRLIPIYQLMADYIRNSLFDYKIDRIQKAHD